MRQTLSKANRPDPDGVPIPVPGAQTTSMKVGLETTDRIDADSRQSGPLRPVDTLNSNGPFASKSVTRTPSHGTKDGRRNNASQHFTPKALRNQTSSRGYAFNEEGPTRKRRRLEAPSEGNMSRKSPIVIPDDVEMGERDDLASSSDKDQKHSAHSKRTLFTRPNKSANKAPILSSNRIEEFHAIEKMMSPPKHSVHTARRPLQVLQSNDPHDEDLFSNESSEDELFTKTSKEQRFEAKGEALPVTTPTHATNGKLALTEVVKAGTHGVPEGILYTSPAGPANDKAESLDALQVMGQETRNSKQARQVPLHEASGSKLVDTILRGANSSTKSAARPKQKVASGKPKLAASRDFDVRRLRYGDLVANYSYKVTIHEFDRILAIHQQADSLLVDGEDFCTVPLSRVVKIHQGEDGCTKVILVMTRIQEGFDDKMHLELVSEKEMCEFTILVQTLAGGTPDILSKSRQVIPDHQIMRCQLTLLRNWMDSAFEKYQQPQSTLKRLTQPYDSRVTALEHDEASAATKATRSHVKRTDQLQSPHQASSLKGNVSTSTPRTVITGEDRRAKNDAAPILPRNDSPNPAARLPSPEAAGVFSKFFRSRATRSSAVHSVPLTERDTETIKPRAKFSQTGELGTPWKKPLVYPKAGKKRETVDFQDLERLDDDEFLNDNLIGFYLRYLEHYLEREKPETAKKVYFFNSYFFERLTQPQKGTKAINYAAVQKWTRTVDIFSRDFVVVPVNENLHWYVAIICNLPNLRRKLADDDEDDDVESVATSETILPTNGESSGKDQTHKEQADEPDGETRSSFAGLSLGDEGDVDSANEDPPVFARDVKPLPSPRQKKGSGRRKSARRSLIKIDPNKPVVITLDSLGLSRTVTRTALKDYVVEEGRAKRSLDLERGALDGVTAKGIPTQKNYSDCGLFLCAYMERFVLDPYQFVHDILQRDMEEGKDWPMMSSDKLRSRLRNFIMELHRHQEGEAEMVSIPDVGRILLRRRSSPSTQADSEPDLQEIPPETLNISADLADEEAASQVNDELTAATGTAMSATSSPELSQGAALKSAEDAVNRASPEKSGAADRRGPQAAIVIRDDSPISPVPRHMSARFRSRANINDDSINAPQELVDNPQVLVDKMRRERSPVTPQGKGRPVSVSTEFMGSLESYARGSTPNEMPGAWDNGEIPETQSQDGGVQAELDSFPDDIIAGL